MHGTFLLAGIAAGLIVLVGAGADSWAAQLAATINPNTSESPFQMKYLKTIHVWYEDGGMIADELRGMNVSESGTFESTHPDVRSLVSRLNNAIIEKSSYASITDMTVDYSFLISGSHDRATIDYKVILNGNLANYVITKDAQRALIDLGWRALSIDGDVIIDGTEINDPFSFAERNMPVTADAIRGTNAERIFEEYMINADFILEQPLENWHFLFDPTGINVDAGTFGLDESIQGFVKSIWTMGESNLEQGRQVERIEEEILTLDQTYIVKSIQAPDQGNLEIIGFGILDTLDGIEIAGVTPKAPEGYSNPATGEFPIYIIYGMAGMAAVAGIAFFFVSSRSLKNEKQGQQGVDPAHLVGYQTSSASGGYQTNRGEAQLKDASDYQQTRSYYEAQSELPSQQQEQEQQQQQQDQPSNSSSAPAIAAEDAACGCASSAEMGNECDCEMQSSCICDGTCPCSGSVCVDATANMR